MLTIERERTGTIREFVDDIIETRKAKRPMLTQKKQELGEILTMLDQFDSMKSQIIDAQGHIRSGKYQQIAAKNPEIPIKLMCLSTSSCREYIKKAQQECEVVSRRFNRERINISVVGEARIGKSTLLQSITNLDKRVIPTSDQDDCTGAVSIIENWPDMPAGAVEATITFKTEQEIIRIVQSYLDVIIKDTSKQIKINTLNQVRTLDIEDVERRVEQFSAEGEKVKHLRAYTEHYDEWAPLVMDGTPVVLHDPAEIQTFVSQHNDKKGKEKIYFYKFLAVDQCRVRCAFDYRDAGKITVVDSVGMGDTKLGIEEAMLKVVRDESDMVIFGHKPKDGASEGVSDPVVKIYKSIFDACPDKNLNDWMSWLINLDRRQPNAEMYCNMALNKLNGSKSSFAGSIKTIVDVSRQEDVRNNFIIPILENMRQNLGAIDALYMKELESALESVRTSYGILCKEAAELMSSDYGNSLVQYGQREMFIQEMNKNINGKLRALAMAEKEKREVPCDILQERVQYILDDMRTGVMIPEKKKLLAEIRQSRNVLDVYLENANNLRNSIVQRFSEVDGSLEVLVKEAKNSVSNILLCEDGCRLGRVLAIERGMEPCEWLREFAELHLDSKRYPNLHAACMKVCNFKFSVDGFLTYEVRACLDEVDPDLSGVPNLSQGDDVKIADKMYSSLLIKLVYVADALEENLTVLFEKPHRAFFAMIKEFKDKVQHAENVEYEWKNLFSEHFAVIWEDEFRSMITAAAAFGDWEKLTLEMRKLNNKISSLEKIA